MSDKPKVAPEAYNIRFPKNTILKLRVREASNEKSKKNGSRMHKLTLEVIESGPFKYDGEDVDINGLDFIKYSVLTEKALTFANKVRQAFGLADLKESDINTADAADFKGQVCYALVESTEEERINEATGEKVLDPYTNKVLMTYRRDIVDWIPKPAGH